MSAVYGIIAGDNLVIVSSRAEGLPVTFTTEPYVPDGYVSKYRWQNQNGQIVQAWELSPIEGSMQDAALRLTQLQARSLPDDALYEFRALAPEWIVGETYYGPDDPSIQQSRVKFQGRLFKCLTGHVPQADWTPTAAPSLWAEILPGQEGNEPEEGYGEWVQPDSKDTRYHKGDKVTFEGEHYVCNKNNVVSSPADDPKSWIRQD